MGYNSNYNLKIVRHSKKEASTTSVEDIIKNAKESAKSGVVNLKGIADNINEVLMDKEMEGVNEDILMERLRDENEEAAYALDSYGDSADACKWYEHVKELKSFSSKYPGWLFTLDINGEETGDVRRVYFLNGKAQEEKARIVLEDFDENKLKG